MILELTQVLKTIQSQGGKNRGVNLVSECCEESFLLMTESNSFFMGRIRKEVPQVPECSLQALSETGRIRFRAALLRRDVEEDGILACDDVTDSVPIISDGTETTTS